MQTSDSSNDDQAQSVPKRLADLRSQLAIKKNALAALREASTFDKKVSIKNFLNRFDDIFSFLFLSLKVISALERDCVDINQEVSALECSLENVDLWWAHLGHWQAQVLPDVIDLISIQMNICRVLF